MVAAAEAGEFDLAGFTDTVDMDSVLIVFEEWFDGSEQVGNLCRADAAFEDALLDSNAVCLHEASDFAEPFFICDIVCDEYEHRNSQFSASR